MDNIEKAFSKLRDPELPPGAWARLEAELKRPASRGWKWGVASAAAAGLVAAVFSMKPAASPHLMDVTVRDVSAGPDLDEWSAYIGHFADAGGVPVAPPDLTSKPPEMERP